MKLIELTETQYRNYSRIHKEKNYCQTVEYTNLLENKKYNKNYLGLIDDNDNVLGATLLLSSSLGIKKGIIPGGFLIDYTNKDLLDTFCKYLKDYLKKSNYIYVSMFPLFRYKVYNSKKVLLQDNSDIVNILNKYNFVATDYTNKFSKYDLVVESKKNLNDIYNSFNSNTKRNIRNSIYMGITIEKANDNELDTFYEMAKKCTKQSISFLKNYLTSYSTPDNAMEVYYAKLKADVYINNYRHLLAKEQKRNRNLNNNLQNNNSKKRNKTISRKMESDRLIEKYNNQIIKGTELLKKYPNGIILGTTAVLLNKKEVYFLMEGHDETINKVSTSHILKWEIIKKYYQQGYRIFNLGSVHNNLNKKGKFYGLYQHKIGFGSDIIEYYPNLDLVLNQFIYKLVKFKKKK